MPSFAPKIRVEVYVPIRYEPAYQDTLTWLIEELTELRGGCTVNENVGVYYFPKNEEVIGDNYRLRAMGSTVGESRAIGCFSTGHLFAS